MELIFVRHGQTKWNKDLRWQGSQDIELDDTGIKQAELLAMKLKDYKIDKIYSSNLKRALKTAEIISGVNGAEVISQNNLQEINLGKWEGLTSEQIKQQYPKEYENWNALEYEVPGVESHAQLQERAYSAVEAIINTNNYMRILIVTHGAFIRALMCKYLHISLEHRLAFESGNTGVFTVKYNRDKQEYRVITLNDVCHFDNNTI